MPRQRRDAVIRGCCWAWRCEPPGPRPLQPSFSTPETLLFGAWDSHTGGGNQVGKWPRCITGRVFGTSTTGRPGAASKGDPLGFDNDAIGFVYKTPDGTLTLDPGQAAKDGKDQPVRFGKGKEAGKLSAAGHGQVITGMGGVDGVDVDGH